MASYPILDVPFNAEKVMPSTSYDERALSTIYDGCCLCIRGARTQVPERLATLPPEEKILHYHSDFVVSGARGAFVEGWLLLFPARHVTSLFQLSRGELESLDALVANVTTVLTNLYQSPALLFEHGSPGDRICQTGRCVDHAHLHCLPANVDMTEYLASRFSQSPVDSFGALSAMASPTEPYLLCWRDNRLTLFRTGVIPSQWMRQLLASKLEVPSLWDWRENPMSTIVAATNARIADSLRK
jgi:diadenosine tetraphosphate (Ap4A) HIT family hydrolase